MVIHQKKALYIFECLETNLFHLLTLSIPDCCFGLPNSEMWNNKTNTRYLFAQMCLCALYMNQSL